MKDYGYLTDRNYHNTVKRYNCYKKFDRIRYYKMTPSR